jgi:hypothetical protein
MTILIAVQDVAASLIFVLANYLLWRATDSITRGFLFREDLAIRVASQITLGWAWIAASAFALNAIGGLSPYSLTGLVSASACCVIWLLRDRLTFQCNSQGPVVRDENSSTRFLPNAIMFIAAFGLSEVALVGIGEFPADWDSLAYHLPIVDHWIQSGNLANQQCAFWYVPGNNELLAFWFAGLFSGDFWIQLNNVPVVILLVASLLAIAEMFCLTSAAKVFLVLSCISCETVFRQLVSAENDLAVGALFISGLAFILKSCFDGNRRAGKQSSPHSWFHANPYPLLIAMSIGLLAGIKYYAVGYALLLGLVAIVVLGLKSGFRAFLQTTMLGLSGFLLLGGYWYIRNATLAGSPLFPKGFEQIGIPDQWARMRPEYDSSTLLRGGTGEIWIRLAWAWLVQANPLALASVGFSMVVSVISIGYLPMKWARRTTVERYYERLALSLAVLGSVSVYLVTPNVIETAPGSMNMLKMEYHSARFGFCLATISSVVAFISLCRVSPLSHKDGKGRMLLRRMARVLVAALGVIAVTNFVLRVLPSNGFLEFLSFYRSKIFKPLANEYSFWEWWLATFDFFLALWMLDLMRRKRRKFQMSFSAVVFLLILTASVSVFLSFRWHRHFDQFYGSFLRDESLASLRVAAAGRPFCICEYRYYPAIGSQRSGLAFRPLFLEDDSAFRTYVEKNECQLVAVPVVDSHWSKAYANLKDWIVNWPSFVPENSPSETSKFKFFKKSSKSSTKSSGEPF